MLDAAASSIDETTANRLFVLNVVMAILHAAQGCLMLALSTDFALPVTTSFLTNSNGPGGGTPEINTLFHLRLGPLVASFLFVSAAAHLAVSLPGARRWYVRNLGRGINVARWYEYAISASIMIVLIAMLTGVRDLNSLLLLFAVNSSMIFFGLWMELQNFGARRTSWTPYILGCVMGIVPWVVISLYLFAPGTRSPGEIPGFVYGIFVSLFVFFNVFALNMFLQYKKIGLWRHYVFGETVYILLSVTAKSALAWQVFTATLN